MKRRLEGIAASPGLCAGRAVLVECVDVEHAGRGISPKEVEGEIERWAEALETASKELAEIEQDVARKLGQAEAEIFGAQAMMMRDPTLGEAVQRMIRHDLISAEKATLQACEAHAKVLEGLDDQYLAARALDMRDIGKRLVRCLLGIKADSNVPRSPEENTVLVAEDLTPSETASLDFTKVSGIVLNKGGKTSHTAILARSFGIPAVAGLSDVTSVARTGDTILVDGDKGIVTVDPGEDELRDSRARIEAMTERRKRLDSLRDLPSVTRDGRHIELSSNIGGEEEVQLVKNAGAEGVGLFRTEFLFIHKDSMPTEEQQFEVYSRVLEELRPRPVVIRTLDAGGDKEIPYLQLPGEENPFLGLRAIRLCLREPEIFRVQLRALLRASVYGNLRIMFPMVASLAELRAAKKEYESVKAELVAEGVKVSPDIQVGIMVEVPSAALEADVLAGECDFFSIGTNDLTQYTMACDRGNPAVGYLSDPFYPAVLRLIARTIEEGHKKGIWVGMCGEMAGMPAAIPLLAGMGIDELSMASSGAPAAKEVVRSLETAGAAEVWQKVKGMTSNTEIRSFLESRVEAARAGSQPRKGSE